MSFTEIQRRRPSFFHALELDDGDYARFVREAFDPMDGETKANVLVAYLNLLPILLALNKSASDGHEPYSVEDFIRGCESDLMQGHGEAINARLSWFMFAAHLGRLEKLASKGVDAANDAGAEIWLQLAESTPELKYMLPESVLWKQSEVASFNPNCSDEELMRLTLEVHMPPVFSKNRLISNFFKSRGVLYHPPAAMTCTIP